MFSQVDWMIMSQNLISGAKQKLQEIGAYASLFISLIIIFMAVKSAVEAVMYGNLLKGLFNCWLVALGSLWTGLGNALLARHARFVSTRGLGDTDVEAAPVPSAPSRIAAVHIENEAPLPLRTWSRPIDHTNS
jgi:hypothetical protein